MILEYAQLFPLKNISPETFDKERIRVVSRLVDIVPEDRLFEVGSTAVEGVIGKQDLDFLIRVTSADFISMRAALDNVFTKNSDQLSNDVYQGYTVDSEMDLAIQLTIESGPYDNFLAFLAKLQANGDLRQKYNSLKLEFDCQLISDYRDVKHQFIERVLASRNDG